MNSGDETLSAQRQLSAWSAMRVVAGLVVIVSVVVMVIVGISAFSKGEDTSHAMKTPFLFALVFLFIFVRSVSRLQRIQAYLKR